MQELTSSKPDGKANLALRTLDPDDVRERVFRTQVEILYRQTVISALATFPAALLLTILLYDAFPTQEIGTWTAGAYVLAALRLASVQAYRRSAKRRRGEPFSPREVGKWCRLQIALTWCTGASWGSAAWFFFSYESILHRAYLIVFLSMVMGAALAGYSILRAAFMGMMVPIFVPLAIRVADGSQLLFAGKGISIVVGLLIFAGLMYLYAIRLRNYSVAMLRFGIERDALALVVEQENRDIESLAARLREEVAVRKAAQERAEFNAMHDPLTGVANRVMLRASLETSLAKARRSSRQLAVLFVDLNRFKQINDSHGHQAGDDVLRTVASSLKTFLRTSDLVARVGGDEFVVVLDELESSEHAMVRIGHIRDRMRTVSIPKLGICVACSVGVALFPRDGKTVDALLACADQGMYGDKRGKRPFTVQAVQRSG